LAVKKLISINKHTMIHASFSRLVLLSMILPSKLHS